MEAIAKGKYLRGSPQKARLVIDMIRGKNVAQALAILKFTNKRATENIEKCLRSAIANATFKAEQENIAIDPDDLWVKTCFVDMGPHKHRRRVRPAPQGRAYREQRYFCHITIEVTSDKPAKVLEAEARRAGFANKPKREKKAIETKNVNAPAASETSATEQNAAENASFEKTNAAATANAFDNEANTENTTAQKTPAANETESTAEEKKT
jgi:large subunit ribosomal protein L22